ncbi:hypothetical protein [uncultured Thermanaerothrix sp.]|uniref:hypothetical protein n=1 Tax=uncultured Thermanaerothrix sp. TaxID=1195149 RepID=UPI002616AF76|nr:hypothetical protein [uncultured Thermanaerothrix sp.]
MAISSESGREQPPNIVAAFVAGFNAVANHLYLILLPVGVDLLLWFAPRLRVEWLFMPSIQAMITSLERYGNPTTSILFAQAWETLLKETNVMGLLRTFPIGVPSLFGGLSDNATPLGVARNLQLTNLGELLGVGGLLLVLGFTLGCLYFALLANATAEAPRFDLNRFFGHQVPSALAFCVLFYLVLAILSVPAFLLLALIAWLLPGLGNVAFFIVALVMIMILFPLIFTPHGIFALDLNPIQAALKSMVLTQPFLPGLPIFILMALILGQGLDLLWRSAPADSWLALVGILGHAFVYSAILAASFVYYRNGIKWMEFLVQRTATHLAANKSQ